MYPVRNSVKAVIIRDNMLLCIRKSDDDGYYYILTGGGQEKDETFIKTLERECIEEIGAKIKVESIKYIREYIGKNHEFRETDDAHQVEYMFNCTLLEEPNSNNATHLDDGQNGIEWISILGEPEPRLYPKILIGRLKTNYEEIYWGDVN